MNSDKAEAVRKAQDQKKRKLFTELKTEMEKDLRVSGEPVCWCT